MADVVTVVVLFALAREAAPFRRRRPDILTHLLGVGAASAQRSLEAIPPPQTLWVAGFSGALTPAHQIGDVVEVGTILDETSGCWPLGDGARLLTTSRIVATPVAKRRLAEQHHADIVDMESAVVAKYAADHNIPLRCVRVISDTCDQSLSPQLAGLLADGNVVISKVLRQLIRKPTMLPELLRLGRATKLAAQTLGDYLADAITRPRC